MRSIIFAAILVVVGLGATDLIANFLESRNETQESHRPDAALAADPAVAATPAPVNEQE